MKDINHHSGDWEKAGNLLTAMAVRGVGPFHQLKQLDDNLEEIEEDIRDLDSDGAITFSHTSHASAYEEIEEDLKTLQRYAAQVDQVVEDTIDDPFYEDLDDFVASMKELSIMNYSTKNRIGATSKQMVPGYGGVAQEIKLLKNEVTVEDILAGDNDYAKQMQLRYQEWKRENPDQDVSQSDFQMSMLHTRAFEYQSIKDSQEEKEFWVNIVATVVIIGTSIVCPPAGIALGAAYGTLEMGSAVSGKDWVSGRKLEGTERGLRGGLSLLDIVPGVKAFTASGKTLTFAGKVMDFGSEALRASKAGAKNTIETGRTLGKKLIDPRITRAKQAVNSARTSVEKGLAHHGEALRQMGETIQRKAGQMGERLTLSGGNRKILAMEAGVPLAGAKEVKPAAAATNKLKERMSQMDLNLPGGGRGGKDGIIKKASGAENDVAKKASGVKFGDVGKLENHFTKHGGEFKGAYSNVDEYIKGANDVIKNGEKVQYNYPLKNGTTELRTGYVKFMGNTSKGKAKFEFVGTNLTGDITTYHVKRGEDVYKLLNGNKHINVINPLE